MLHLLSLAAGIAALVATATAASLAVNNPEGGVAVVVSPGSRLTVSGMTPNGPAEPSDLYMIRRGQDIRVEVLPRDTQLDLTINLPLGFSLEIETIEGDISVDGMVHLVRLDTDTGAIQLKAPLRGIRMTLDADTAPPGFVNPDRGSFRAGEIELAAGRSLWRLRDRLPENAIYYGAYRIKAKAPREVTLSAFVPPPDWPLRFHWEAPDELRSTLERSTAVVGGSLREGTPASSEADDEVVFRSDVRMVNLTLAVSDAAGRPAKGLTATDFRIVEGGVEQRLGPVQAGDASFNLAIVLDMSGSAITDRAPLVDAARRFVELARPGDRVAIYALTQGMFRVVSALSSDREALLAVVNNLPIIDGASPLYDIVTLAYAQELRQLPGERNALIVISDGLDNQVTGQEVPSRVKFKDLTRAAEEMHAIIYPVYLLSGKRFGRGWSKRGMRRMQDLADASGGRVFPADSIADLDPVFPLIEAELRSVYTLGYYPDNQEFDGAWRAVEIAVEKPGLKVRARPGYYAN
jgi:VWFA-related protein